MARRKRDNELGFIEEAARGIKKFVFALVMAAIFALGLWFATPYFIEHFTQTIKENTSRQSR